jgi:hypothetical protein
VYPACASILFMSNSIGRKIWAIAEGYIPAWSNGPEPEFTSHEAFCVLNTTDQEAHIVLTLYYADREPTGPYRMTLEARRTQHSVSTISLIQSQYRWE